MIENENTETPPGVATVETETVSNVVSSAVGQVL